MQKFVAGFRRWRDRAPAIDAAGPAPEDAAPAPDPAQPYDAGAQEYGPRMTELAQAASKLGFEVVDVAAFLTALRDTSRDQLEILGQTHDTSRQLIDANAAVRAGIDDVSAVAQEARQRVDGSVTAVRLSAQKARNLARWAASVADQVAAITASLSDVQQKTVMIEDIAFQVNILSLNAGIEAARAGDAGRGFAVIAQMINDLSDRTNQTAEDIRASVQALNGSIAGLAAEARDVQGDAEQVIDDSRRTDENLAAIAGQIGGVQDNAQRITAAAERVTRANDSFLPAFEQVGASVRDTAARLKTAMERVNSLNDRAEAIVQKAASMGGEVEDASYIQRVMQDAATLSELLETAVRDGRISMTALFSREYRPIPGTRPQQVLAPFTRLTDQLFPPVQEAALDLSDKVVFCAAVNRDGYLPTHNAKFSRPQGSDEAWNTAHCRNRRIFDDRVGLKAGRNTEPFLLQVYRRDMGGGTFALMKDVSAPILVEGRHWGGLRLAYKV